MLEKIVLDDGFGFANIAVGQNTATIDLWEANNTYVRLSEAAGDDSLALMQAWCDWLAAKGLPGLSHGAGIRLQEHIIAAIQGIKKNGPLSTNAA